MIVVFVCFALADCGLNVQVPTQPTNKNRRGERKAPKEPETVSDDATVEEAQVLSTAESEALLHRCHHLFKSCSQICIEGIENIPMQSALMQSVNTIAIYLLQENARLLRFRNLASEELATLKPVAQVWRASLVCLSVALMLWLVIGAD